MRRRRRITGAAATLAAAGAIALALTAPPVVTDAAWSDSEFGSSSVSALTVASPGAVRCVQSGLLVPAVLGWNAAPAGGNVTGYRWTLVGASNRSGTLAATATSVTLNANAVELGTSTFTLYAVGPGGWERAATNTAAVGFISIALGVTSSCSTPAA
ncbi:hypothetical protein HW566_07560 [Microbacterium oleivorans]|uniref:Uncharacterized protein n=2 Tax=Microbacterium oleivorans TaxID=273677 RepID=A0A7D5IPI5_9MICO|nr:hypothetical protein HW566_07560 [Microbacterium oleivorans]